MIKTILLWTGLVIAMFALQTTLAPVITVAGVKPDFLILVLFLVSVKTGVLPAIYIGFMLGLAQDFYSPDILGQNALAKTVLGFFSGLFNEKVIRIDPILQIVLLVLAFVIHDLIYFAVQVVKSGSPLQLAGTQIFTTTLPRALYTLVFALIPVFWENMSTKRNRR